MKKELTAILSLRPRRIFWHHACSVSGS